MFKIIIPILYRLTLLLRGNAGAGTTNAPALLPVTTAKILHTVAPGRQLFSEIKIQQLKRGLLVLCIMFNLLGAAATKGFAANRFAVASGNWNATSTWSATSGGTPNASVPVAGDVVTLEGGFTVTVNVNSACSSIQFGHTGSPAAAGVLTFSGSSTLTVSGSVVLGNNISGSSGTITFTSGSTLSAGSLVIGGSIAGANGTVNMTAGGTLSLAGAVTLGSGTATWTPGTGTLIFTASQTLPATILTTFNNLEIKAGTTTASANLNATAAGILTVRAGATLALGSYSFGAVTPPASLVVEGGAVSGAVISGTGKLTLGGNVTVSDANTGTDGANISCPIDLGAATRTFTVPRDANDPSTSNGVADTSLTISGIISGSGGMIKEGLGRLVLCAANTYTGSTTVKAGLGASIDVFGILNLKNNLASGTTAGGIFVERLARLEMEGGISVNEPLSLIGEGGTNSGGALFSVGNNTITNTWLAPITIDGGSYNTRINSSATTLILANSITLNGGLIIQGSSVNAASPRIDGVISGSGGFLNKVGVGQWTITNANTFTGNTIHHNGTLILNNTLALGPAGSVLQIGGVGNTPSLDNTSGSPLTLANYVMSWFDDFTVKGTNPLNMGTGAVTMGADRRVTVLIKTTSAQSNFTVGGVITGNGFKLTKAGAGSITLSGTNVFTGGTTLERGTLNIGNAQALGTVAGTFTIGGASLTTVIDNTSGAALTTLNYPMLWKDDLTFTGSNPLNLGTGNTTLEESRLLTTTASELTVGGIISGTGLGLTKAGAGTLTLTGTSSFSGGTTLSDGILNINNPNALGDVTGTFTIAGGTIDNTSGAAITTVSYPLAINADFSYNGSLSRTLNLGSGNVTFGANRNITVSAATLTIGGVIAEAGNSLTKSGPGTLAFGSNAVTLNGLSILAGTLTASSGVLTLNGDMTNDATFVPNGGTVAFVSALPCTISGSATTSFNNIIKSGGGSLTLNRAANVAGNATLSGGIIYTTAVNLLHFADNATVTGGSNTAHISGPVKKTGNDAFVFPLGKGGRWARAGISAPALVTDAFTAEYFNTPYSDLSVTPAINNVSFKEYWDIDRTAGSSPITLTLYFEVGGFSGINQLNTIALFLAHYNGSDWEDPGGVRGVSGTVNTGTVSMGNVNVFSPFTFASAAGSPPLPVTWRSFTARCTSPGAQLQWSTANETGNDHFNIEQSTDGIRWQQAGTVKGAGNSSVPVNYTFALQELAAGTTYFRLLQTGLNGNSVYSTVVTLKHCATAFAISSISPNPGRGQLQVSYTGSKELVRSTAVYNSTGSCVYRQASFRQLIDLRAQPAGIYYVHFTGEDTHIVKQVVLQ